MEKEISYEEAFERLNAIVDQMSSVSVPLDDLIRLYEEGMELAKYCEKLLAGYEARLRAYSKQTVLNEIEAADRDTEEDL